MTLNNAVFAPIANAMVRTAAMVKTGFRRRERNANRMAYRIQPQAITLAAICVAVALRCLTHRHDPFHPFVSSNSKSEDANPSKRDGMPRALAGRFNRRARSGP